jgi:outer membrane usher protein FimD/PapC
MTHQSSTDQAGMIIDVVSDLDEIALRADDMSGMGAVLKPGRNFVPVSAYEAGSVQFDFEGGDSHAATVQPARMRYHLNKGGVAYQQIRVMKTMTVLGRLVGADGQPLKGHHVINHASRGVSEVDGFFSMEMSEGTPTLEVQHTTEVLCRFKLDPALHEREDDVLMVGDLRCLPETLAQVESFSNAAG